MNLRSLLITTFLFALLCCVALMAYHRYYATKTAYIDIKTVFNGFSMKAELEEKYKQVQKGRDKILDSLSFNLKILSKHLNEQQGSKAGVDKEELLRYEYSRDEFLKLKKQYQADNAALSQKYDAQILSQLTQYVIEFGKANNYDMILGADGNGTLMYSKDNYNISDEVLVFINNKYKGID